ncbi:MAG: hypothetical protein FGM52_07575 [Mycobacterium sp.]|nr:hypothetical protein [Mycobacterium sp.]
MADASEPPDGSPGTFEDRVLDAAIDEFRIRGVDGFSIDGVAGRAGVDPARITERWHDWRVLLMDAQLSRARSRIPTPMNGDLRRDLAEYSEALAELAETTQGRRWFHRNLPTGHDTDFSEVRADFWDIRFRDILPFLQQAAERGEIRPDIDLTDAIGMFSAAVYFDVTFYDRAVRPRYLRQVLDIFLNGILTERR